MGHTCMYTCKHSMIISNTYLFPFVNKQIRAQWKYSIAIFLHKGSKASTYTNAATYLIIFSWQCSVAGSCHTTNIQTTYRILTWWSTEVLKWTLSITLINSHSFKHKMCSLQTQWKVNWATTLTVFSTKKIMYMDYGLAYKHELNKMIK